MSTVPTHQQILRLYKELIRYGQRLQYTDKDYFCNRIRTEFRRSAKLTELKDITFNFKRGSALLERQSVV